MLVKNSKKSSSKLNSVHLNVEVVVTQHSHSIKKKTPLLMLHGWGRSLESLRALANCLTRNHYVYLVDLPGFGKSGFPNFAWSTEDYAERLRFYLDSLNIEQVDFLGHSFGGKVALSFALRYPERVRNLILISSSGLAPLRTIKQKIKSKSIQFLGKAIKACDSIITKKSYSNYFIPRYGSIDYKNAGKLRPILVKTVNEDLSSKISTISARTLIIWGEDDLETPIEMAHRFHNSLQNSKLLIFPGKGHEPFERLGSHLIASYISPFLLYREEYS